MAVATTSKTQIVIILLVIMVCNTATQGMRRQQSCRGWREDKGQHYCCSKAPIGYLNFPIDINFLHLDNISIKNLTTEAFQNLNKLTWLNLSDNRISDIPSTIFDKNVRLEVLDLSYNKIESLPNSLFQNLINLHVLNLQKNRIHSLPDDIFSNQRELDRLDVSLNRLFTLRETILSPIAKPEYLNISGNRFQCDCDLLGVRIWVEKHFLNVDADCDILENKSSVHWSKIEHKDVCHDSSMMNDTEKSNSRSWIIAVSVIVVIIAISLLIVVFWKRRKSSRFQPRAAHKLEEAPEKNDSEDSVDLDEIYAKVNKNKKGTIRKQNRPESVGFYASLKEESLYSEAAPAIQLRDDETCGEQTPVKECSS